MRRVWVLLCVLLVACSRGPINRVTLLYASPYSSNHPFSIADKIWMKWLESESHGHIVIRAVWGGALISADQSMFELRHGVADIGLITPIYEKGGTELLRTQTGFYLGADSFRKQVSLYGCMLRDSKEMQRELQGLKVLAVQGGTLPGLVLRDSPIQSLEGLRSLRIRAPNELLSVLRDLGADPVNMPMGEVYSALAKHIIDGVVAPIDTLKSLHFGEVAHYYIGIAIPRGAYPARAMSQRRWNSLSVEDQQLLERSVNVWEKALDEQTQKAVSAGQQQGERDGVRFSSVSAADQTRFNALYERDAERNAAALSTMGIDGTSALRSARSAFDGSIPSDCVI
jgi:TRAP-type C4-dicarboxylate transport system substrate-binding protein